MSIYDDLIPSYEDDDEEEERQRVEVESYGIYDDLVPSQVASEEQKEEQEGKGIIQRAKKAVSSIFGRDERRVDEKEEEDFISEPLKEREKEATKYEFPKESPQVTSWRDVEQKGFLQFLFEPVDEEQRKERAGLLTNPIKELQQAGEVAREVLSKPEYYELTGDLADIQEGKLLDKQIAKAQDFLAKPENLPTTEFLAKAQEVIIDFANNNPTYSGAIRGMGQTLFGSGEKAMETLDRQLVEPLTWEGKVLNKMGEIPGKIIPFVLTLKAAEAVGFVKVAYPIAAATMGQTSVNANLEQRLKKMPVDVIAGFLYQAIPAHYQFTGFSKESIAAVTKGMAAFAGVGGSSVFINSLIMGLPEDEAMELAIQSALTMSLFYAAGSATNYFISPRQGFVGDTYTADEINEMVYSANAQDTPAGKDLLRISREASSVGKDVRLDVNAIGNSPAVKIGEKTFGKDVLKNIGVKDIGQYQIRHTFIDKSAQLPSGGVETGQAPAAIGKGLQTGGGMKPVSPTPTPPPPPQPPSPTEPKEMESKKGIKRVEDALEAGIRSIRSNPTLDKIIKNTRQEDVLQEYEKEIKPVVDNLEEPKEGTIRMFTSVNNLTQEDIDSEELSKVDWMADSLEGGYQYRVDPREGFVIADVPLDEVERASGAKGDFGYYRIEGGLNSEYIQYAKPKTSEAEEVSRISQPPEPTGEGIPIEEMPVEQRVEKAKELGRQAFEEDKSRVPAQDQELRELLQGIPMGEETQNIMRSWIDEYDRLSDEAAREVLEGEPTELKKVTTKSIESLNVGESTVVPVDAAEYKEIENLSPEEYEIEELDEFSSMITRIREIPKETETVEEAPTIEEELSEALEKVSSLDKALSDVDTGIGKTVEAETALTYEAENLFKDIRFILDEDSGLVEDIARYSGKHADLLKEYLKQNTQVYREYTRKIEQPPATKKVERKVEARGEVDSLFEEDYTDIKESITHKYGDKSLTDLSASKITDLLEGKIAKYTKSLGKKFGAFYRAIDYSGLEGRPALMFGGVEDGVFSDGYLMVLDRDLSNEMRDKVIEKKIKKMVRYHVDNSGMSYNEADEEVRKELGKEETPKYPDYKKVLPEKENYIKASIIGTTSIGETPLHILKAGSRVELVNAEDLGFFQRNLPDAEIYISREEGSKVIGLYKGDSLKGVVTTTPANEIRDRIKEVVGSPPRPKTPSVSGKGTQASMDRFADLKIAADQSDYYKGLEFPEMLQMVKELTGQVPSVKYPRISRAFGSRPYGLFRPAGRGEIELNPDVFKSPVQAAKTFGHEIGHLSDWLPDKISKRGNLIGHVASLNSFLRHTFTSDVSEARIDDLKVRQKELQEGRKAAQSKEEDRRLLKELKEVNKEIKEIRENPSLELDKLNDELRKLTLMWKPFDVETASGSFIEYRFSKEEMYADALSVLFNDPDLLKKEAPTFWKGFFSAIDRKPEVRNSYFKALDLLNRGEEEIYKQRDETITDSFRRAEDAYYEKRMEYANRKFGILDKIRTLFDNENHAVNKMVAKQMREGVKLENRKNPLYELAGLNYTEGKLKNFVQKYFQPALNKANEVKSQDGWELVGKITFLERIMNERGATENPVGHLKEVMGEGWGDLEDILPDDIEEMSSEKQLKIMEEKFGDMVSGFVDEGSLWDEIQALLPKSIANPFGFDADTAAKQLGMMRKDVPEEDWDTAMEAVKMFRDSSDEIVQRVEDGGFYTEELIEKMKMNPSYATFQVVDYIETYVSSRAYKQVGTLKDISNPATASLMKYISILQSIERNNAKKVTLNWMKDLDATEVKDAKSRWVNGRREFVKPRDKDLDLVITIEKGKPQGYYVPKDVGQVLNGADNKTIRDASKVIKKLTGSKTYRILFTGINVGFMTTNFARDFNRLWLQTPQETLVERLASAVPVLGKGKQLYRYVQAAPIAKRRVEGKYDKIIEEMRDISAIGGLTFYDYYGSPDPKDNQAERVLEGLGLLKDKEDKREVYTAVSNVFETVGNWGDFIESLSKIAAYLELKGKMPDDELAHFIRTKAGSPDFRVGGLVTPVTNNTFLFSNAMKEGWKTDLRTLLKKPRSESEKHSRSGYILKIIMSAVLPAIAGYLMEKGFFGEETQDTYEGASEYDRTNYQVIPLSKDKNGKSIYMRVPMDEVQRFTHALTRKTLQLLDSREIDDLAQIFDLGAGQTPSVAPSIESFGVLATFFSGRNPYDSFRGQYIIPDTAFKAGWKESFPYMFDWFIKNQGASIVIPQYKLEGTDITSMQRFLNLPVVSNILGRWIKVSDYGKTQALRKIAEKEKKETAKRLIGERKILDEAVKEYLSGSQSMSEKYRIIREAKKDIIGDPPYSSEEKRKATNFKKKFNISVIKEEASPEVRSLIYANTNKEKVALLNKIKEDMSYSEFLRLKKMLLDEKIVSKKVLKELK